MLFYLGLGKMWNSKGKEVAEKETCQDEKNEKKNR